MIKIGLLFLCSVSFLKGNLHKFTPLPYKDRSIIYLSSGFCLDTQEMKTSTHNGRYWILKLKGPIYEKDREEIETKSAEILDYLPNYAYIIRTYTPESLISLSQVEWMGPVKPEYKLSPLLKRAGMDTVMVLLFPGEDIEGVSVEIERMGGKVLDRFKREIKALIDLSKVRNLAEVEGVYWIEPYRTSRIINSTAQWVIQDFYPELRKVWDRGLKGEGEIISLLDSGIRTTHNMFRDPNVPINDFGEYPDHRKIIAYKATGEWATFGDEEYPYHGTHTSATAAGDDGYVGGISPYDGMAPECKIYFLDGGAGGGLIYVGRDFNHTFSMPYEGGARVISNSYAVQPDSPPPYTLHARNIDEFMWEKKDCLFLFGAGNNPPTPYISLQSASKNCIAVGAVGNGIRAHRYQNFSAHGPTADGRFKPTLMAPGVLTSAYGIDDTSYIEYSGTSMSTPCAAGGAILVREYLVKGFYPTGEKDSKDSFNPSSALLKAMLINSCDGDVYDHYIPDNYIGWGRIDLDKVLYFSGDERGLLLVDNGELSTGEYQEYPFRIENSQEPLRVTLVWTDYPASPISGKALVNDLNLEVIAPDNERFKGNVFSNGESITGGDWDELNVEENVRIRNPMGGRWKIRVYGADAPYPPQPYSLVITGGVKSLAVKPKGSLITPYEFSVKTPAFSPLLLYELPCKTRVRVSVYNPTGERVRDLIDEIQGPGRYSVIWDGRDKRGVLLPSGIYFYKLSLGGYSIIRKGVFLKR